MQESKLPVTPQIAWVVRNRDKLRTAQGVLSSNRSSSPQGNRVRGTSRCECPHADRSWDAKRSDSLKPHSKSAAELGWNPGLLTVCPVHSPTLGHSLLESARRWM